MATDPAAMVTSLAHSGSLIHKPTDASVCPYKSAPFEIFRRTARKLMPLSSGREALESPTLVGDTCLNDYPVERRRDVSISERDFADSVVPTTTDF
ncbi:hypothetical protein ALC56_15263 [Trachymyrmex septentrionalis]|uniref:Uncharacterized protein n=1 Tax=Trachymyrmex septentrionalis TaxID=34720 RepID=A0A195ERN9_9HYME|nr:hypothetical protein ALC56_15263 [Trachymyrmex septentrionalis]